MRTNQEIMLDVLAVMDGAKNSEIIGWAETKDWNGLVNAFKQILLCEIPQDNTNGMPKSAWEDFVSCDKDRSDTFDGINRSDLNCLFVANLRYNAACESWANTLQRFVDLVYLETGREPIWDTQECQGLSDDK